MPSIESRPPLARIVAGRRTTWLAAITVLIACLAVWLHNVDVQRGANWGCEMSWMTPSYTLMDTDGSPTPRYRLYLYREQGWDTSQLVGQVLVTSKLKIVSQTVTLLCSFPATQALTNRSDLLLLPRLASIMGAQEVGLRECSSFTRLITFRVSA